LELLFSGEQVAVLSHHLSFESMRKKKKKKKKNEGEKFMRKEIVDDHKTIMVTEKRNNVINMCYPFLINTILPFRSCSFL
jgi:hypothetical protein